MKTILIAIPTNKYIEPETMKAIYDLKVPSGYTTEFQFFYGYQVDQIRNLIASWAVRYDYLFAVDSDIVFKPDTLERMLAHNLDIVSGLYIQRKPGQHILELYKNGTNVRYEDVKGKGIIEVDSCGFGCVLIKSEVFRTMVYPHFYYQSAIDHKFTVSEDTYFCNKARTLGFRVFADTDILCEHIGSTKYVVDANPAPPKPVHMSSFDRLMELSNQRLLPTTHVDYLYRMRQAGHEPKVVYDIGACVLHWTREAVNVWPSAKYFAFEAMPESAELFRHFNVPHVIGVFSAKDNQEVEFFQNTYHPGGNSYYPENTEVNPTANVFYEGATKRKVKTITLDTAVKAYQIPLPDLIKMDVQGAELDVLKGASEVLSNCRDLILELQAVEYNRGAPLNSEVIDYLKGIGFELINEGPFSNNGFDGDYHFSRL